MKQYMLSVFYVDGQAAPEPDVIERMIADVETFNQSLRDSGAWVFAGGLCTPDIATVVNATGSDVVITDGPFAESKEHVGGFWIVNVPDLDAAMELARQGSAACRGPVEVRPFQDDPEG